MKQEFVGRVGPYDSIDISSIAKVKLETYVETRDQHTGKPWVVGWRGVISGLPMAMIEPAILGKHLRFEPDSGEPFEFFVCGYLAGREHVEIAGIGAWPGKGDPFNED